MSDELDALDAEISAYVKNVMPAQQTPKKGISEGVAEESALRGLHVSRRMWFGLSLTPLSIFCAVMGAYFATPDTQDYRYMFLAFSVVILAVAVWHIDPRTPRQARPSAKGGGSANDDAEGSRPDRAENTVEKIRRVK